MREYADVVVIGAGLSGGVVTTRLAAAGIKVVCLEQGGWPDYQKARADYDDYEITSGLYWARDPNVRHGAADYPINDADSEVTPLMWNGVGGSTVLYSAKWHRMTPSDFCVRTLDGIAEDWPLSYADLEPYYVEAERQFGVSGLAGDPAYPDGAGPPTPPLPLRPFGARIAAAMNPLGWHWWPGSSAIASRDFGPLKACRQHGACMAGCPEGAKASTDITHWPEAMRHGAGLVVGARVSRVITSGGKVTGVRYRDPAGNEAEIDTNCVVMAANGVGTPRLLLASASNEYPDGLGNGSGLVGKNLMMHPFSAVAGVFPESVGGIVGTWGQQLYSMEFYESDPTRGFVRGAKWSLSPTGGPLALTRNYPWGNSERELWFDSFHGTMRARLDRSAMWGLVAEDLPEESNRVTLDEGRVDQAGVPAAKIDYRVSENSKRLLDWHIGKAQESLYEAGAVETVVGNMIRASGWHLMGTARMGADPRTSVTDRWGAVHDVEGLWIADSSTWVTSSGVNPSATQAALALWTADRMIETKGAR